MSFILLKNSKKSMASCTNLIKWILFSWYHIKNIQEQSSILLMVSIKFCINIGSLFNNNLCLIGALTNNGK